MNLLFVVSDHGFGHATRTVALLRAAFASRPDTRVRIVCGDGASRFLRDSFAGDGRVTVRERESDPGMFLFPGTLRVDTPGTAEAWRAWAGRWETWARDEAEECGPVDGVLTDGTPPALMTAARLGVPSILLGNFAWSDVLSWHLPDDLLGKLRRTLGLATAAFAYPYHLEFDGAPRPGALPLVARRPTRSREEMRRLLGVSEDEPMIYLSAGQSSSPDTIWGSASAVGARPLVGWNAPEIPGAVRIPQRETESQDYLAAADLIVGKVGYGTLSEGLVCGVPMIMVLVDRTPETDPLVTGMREAGAGQPHTEGEDLLPPIRSWLGRARGAGRPYVEADAPGAARILFDALDDLR